MILILGGAFQGKLSYALELTGYRREDFADGADCSWDAVFSARGIYHFEEYIRAQLRAACRTIKARQFGCGHYCQGAGVRDRAL